MEKSDLLHSYSRHEDEVIEYDENLRNGSMCCDDAKSCCSEPCAPPDALPYDPPQYWSTQPPRYWGTSSYAYSSNAYSSQNSASPYGQYQATYGVCTCPQCQPLTAPIAPPPPPMAPPTLHVPPSLSGGSPTSTVSNDSLSTPPAPPKQPLQPYNTMAAAPPAPTIVAPTAKPPTVQQTPASGLALMCCYHKRGVCKKGDDCWYSHDGTEETPCHYGVKCAAGHALLSRNALDSGVQGKKGPKNAEAGNEPNAIPPSQNKIPVWARHPFKHTNEPAKNANGAQSQPAIASSGGNSNVTSYVSAPLREVHYEPLAPLPVPPHSNGKLSTPSQPFKTVRPPTLDGLLCKFCCNESLYVMPYRAFLGNQVATLQYRIHCMTCHGSWTP